jgi:hypothetical protein
LAAGRLLETRAIRSSILERNSFRIGEALALLYKTTRSIVGTCPIKGRLMTDHGRKGWTYAGSKATLRVEAIRDIATGRIDLNQGQPSMVEKGPSRGRKFNAAGVAIHKRRLSRCF